MQLMAENAIAAAAAGLQQLPSSRIPWIMTQTEGEVWVLTARP